MIQKKHIERVLVQETHGFNLFVVWTLFQTNGCKGKKTGHKPDWQTIYLEDINMFSDLSKIPLDAWRVLCTKIFLKSERIKWMCYNRTHYMCTRKTTPTWFFLNLGYRYKDFQIKIFHHAMVCWVFIKFTVYMYQNVLYLTCTINGHIYY